MSITRIIVSSPVRRRDDRSRAISEARRAGRSCACGLLAVAVALAVPASRAHAASASASAYGYQGSDGQTLLPTASAYLHYTGTDFPGYTDATSHAKLGWLDGVTVMFGCGVNAPFQQVCNNGGTSADFDDLITVLANAPNGTPVDIQATLDLLGSINGTGGYFYQANGTLFDQSRGISGTTGGTVQTGQNLSLNSTQTWTKTLLVGSTYNISGHLQTNVINRICAIGTNTCTASISEWTMTLAAVATLRFQVLSPVAGVQLLGQGSHDYLEAPTAVGPGESSNDRLRVESANPSAGPVAVALELAQPTNVEVAVFDLAGRRLATLSSGAQPAGTRVLTWDGRDLAGHSVIGMCFVRARGEGFTAQRRVLMIH